jgi:hypothetical protein
LPGFRPADELEKLLEANHPSRFKVEEVYGPNWPPYNRWLGTGPAQRPVGKIWWFKAEGEL